MIFDGVKCTHFRMDCLVVRVGQLDLLDRLSLVDLLDRLVLKIEMRQKIKLSIMETENFVSKR